MKKLISVTCTVFALHAGNSLAADFADTGMKQTVRVCINVEGDEKADGFYAAFTSDDPFDSSLMHSTSTVKNGSACEQNVYSKGPKNTELDKALNIPIGNFRVNVVFHLNGIAATYRVIPDRPPTFDELKLPQVLKSLLVLSHGLVLITGPTGSGKSTTVAAMLEYINTMRSSQIITIEDPIEFIFKSKKSIIMQRQVKRDTPDVAAALRSALRHDPDVIMLGEMRDLETIRLVLTAAETGHLVIATLHASSAPLAISRIIDVFPSAEKYRVRNLLSETIQAVICQTLVKKVNSGRVAAFEIMLATPAIRHLIREDKIPHMVMTLQTNGDIGMCTLEQYLQELVSKRLITHATARSATMNHDRFQL